MNWHDFLPAAVRDMQAHSSEWEDASGWSATSFEYTNAERTGTASYEQDDFSGNHRTLEDMSSIDFSYYGADQYSRDDVETIFDEEDDRIEKRQAKHPPSRANIVLVRKPLEKETVPTIRIPFFSDLLDMALSKPTPKKKFTRLFVPQGLPQPPSLLDDETDIYDLPSPPSLVYEYRVLE